MVKPQGALITAADMTRLEVIEADDAGIRNLTGLEAATELELDDRISTQFYIRLIAAQRLNPTQ